MDTPALFAAARDLSTTPEQRIAAIIDLQADLEQMVSSNVAQMRARGASWDDVATATGLTRQGAHKRWSI